MKTRALSASVKAAMKDLLRIIVVGGEKGGSTKSTIAVNLAVLLANDGFDVCLVDTDPQGSANAWAAERDTYPHLKRITVIQKTGKGLTHELENLAGRFDFLVVDAGGRDSVELRSALVKADLLISPVQSTIFDLWTIEKVSNLVIQVQAINENLKAVAVLSRVAPSVVRADARAAATFMENYPALKLLNAKICERVAFQRSILQGMGVIETAPVDEKAVLEIQALYREIFKECVTA